MAHERKVFQEQARQKIRDECQENIAKTLKLQQEFSRVQSFLAKHLEDAEFDRIHARQLEERQQHFW